MDKGIILIIILLSLAVYVSVRYCVMRQEIEYHRVEIKRAVDIVEKKKWQKRLLRIYLEFIPFLGRMIGNYID